MAKSNGLAMKILIPLLVVGAGGTMTAAWKLYDNMHAEVKDLQEKVQKLSIVVNLTNSDIAGIKPKIESLFTWAQTMDRNQVRILERLGIQSSDIERADSSSAFLPKISTSATVILGDTTGVDLLLRKDSLSTVLLGQYWLNLSSVVVDTSGVGQ